MASGFPRLINSLCWAGIIRGNPARVRETAGPTSRGLGIFIPPTYCWVRTEHPLRYIITNCKELLRWSLYTSKAKYLESLTTDLLGAFARTNLAIRKNHCINPRPPCWVARPFSKAFCFARPVSNSACRWSSSSLSRPQGVGDDDNRPER